MKKGKIMKRNIKDIIPTLRDRQIDILQIYSITTVLKCYGEVAHGANTVNNKENCWSRV